MTDRDDPIQTAVVTFIGLVVLVAGLTALLMVVASGDGATGGAAAAASSHGDVAPLDLASVPAPMAAHYRYARAHLAEFQQIPCWCGCEQFLGHRSLADCFVRADGRGWEAHASGCAVCSTEAAMAERMLDGGRSPLDVKDAVDRELGTSAITVPPAA